MDAADAADFPQSSGASQVLARAAGLFTDVSFPGVLTAPKCARRHTRRCLAGFPDEIVDDVELMICELVTNSVRYSRSSLRDGLGRPGRVGLTIAEGDGTLRVEVSDAGSQDAPHLCGGEGDDEGSRGLALVQELSTDWGVRWDGGRTVVWFETSLNGR